MSSCKGTLKIKGSSLSSLLLIHQIPFLRVGDDVDEGGIDNYYGVVITML